MRYKCDWDRAQAKLLEYWEMENHDRPLLAVTAPREGYKPVKVKAPADLVSRWTDTEYVINKSRENMASTFFGGEAIPILNPNLGPDIFAGFLGCDIKFGETTSWANHFINDWHEVSRFEFDPQNKWWLKMKQMTEEMAADAKGDYLVGITDLHSGTDGLVSLRGPENLCMDLYDDPDSVKKAVFELFEVFKTVSDELYRITTKNQAGSTNWMGVWHPGKWYVTSCDFICMISQHMFSEFILPELLEEIDYLDASIFHLDGPGALKHLDALLQIPKLKGIQWVYGAGQPSASYWIPTLKKVQDAGKCIHVSILPEELDVLMENLKPEGVLFTTHCNSEQDAKDLIKKAEGFYKR